ncbi:hypothetical protein DRO53_00155 [Candidatus Bathyarchaeota archaeon]|nr:MAG: hypothetical protein DRO53_00155 [Candidatus Bathyarchaeota archaeon]
MASASVTILIVLLLLFSTFQSAAAYASTVNIEEEVHEVSSVVEQLRGLPFKYIPPVSLVDRASSLSRLGLSEWEGWELAQQEYEALYMVSPGQNVKELLEEFYGSALLGYYDTEKNEIVVVKGEEEAMDRNVLAHELTHALLDQYYPETFELEYELTDKDLAVSAVLEGDAELVEELFGSQLSGCELNLKAKPAVPLAIIYLQVFPYFEGYNFVKYLREKGGWEAVNEAYKNPPESTEQVIHPEKYLKEKPLKVELKPVSFDGWKPLGEDILGEAAIFMMFWNQGLAEFSLSPQGRITYKSKLSDGWAGDLMVVYKKDENRYGYVWLLCWDTVKDALEFKQRYEEMLTRMGAMPLNGGAWQLEDRWVTIHQRGRTVTIVSAPSRLQIDSLRMAAGLPIFDIEFTSLKGGQTLTSTIRNLTPEDQEGLILIQVKDWRGRVEAIYQIQGEFPAGSRLSFETPILCQKVFQIEIYVWKSFEKPVPLAKPLVFQPGGWSLEN